MVVFLLLLCLDPAWADIAPPTPPAIGEVEDDLPPPGHPDTPLPAWVVPAAGGGTCCGGLVVVGGLGVLVLARMRKA